MKPRTSGVPVCPIPTPLVVVAVLGCSLASEALAQAEEEEADVVVTAPIEGSRIESLQGAEILRREDIVANLTGNLGDTLDATPGISTTFFGAGASRPIIRGLGEDRVRVLQNGIGAIDASTVSPDHAVTSDGLDAERIEVLRGSAALAFGGNAIGGVVNVSDQSIPRRPMDGVSFQGLAAYSSVDAGAHGATSIGFGADSFAFRINAAASETQPYQTPIAEAANQYTRTQSYGAGGAFVGAWGFAGLAVKRTEDEYGLLPHHAGEAGGHIEMEQTRIESRGDFRVSFGPFDRLDYGVQQANYRHTEFEGDGAPGTTFTSEGWEARLEGHHRGEALRGAVGVQASNVNLAAAGEEAFLSATATRDVGVFAVERLDRGGWGVEAGARYERRELRNADNGALDFDALSAAAGLFFRPAEGWFVGGTLARSERAPTAVELFSDGLHLATQSYETGNPDLRPETALSLEVSLRRENSTYKFEANLYRIEFENYIALVDSGAVFWIDEASDSEGFDPPTVAPIDAELFPAFHFTQQDAVFAGGEISTRARLFEAGGFEFSGDAAYDWVRASFEGGGHPPRIPPYSLTVGLEAQNAIWSGRIEAVHTGKQDRLASFETETGAFTSLNASLAFRPDGENGAWSLRIDARNLADELGRVHSSFLKEELPLPGRNVRFSLLAEF